MRRFCYVPMGCLFLVLLLGCQKAEVTEPIRPVKAIRVADASGLVDRAHPGRARAGNDANLSFRVSGPLIAFPIDVGDEVKKGETLAQIDPRDFEVRLRNAEGQLADAEAALVRATEDYNRSIQIQKDDPGAISQAAVDRATQGRDGAAATVKALQATVDSANDDLGYTTLTAPFDGVVVAKYVENFENVLQKRPILRLLDQSTIKFDIAIPETLIGYAQFVEEITIRFDAFPGRDFAGEIKEIGREATQATRTYPVTLIMDQPADAEIMSGMAGSARIAARLPRDAKEVGIEIPASATFGGNDPTTSFVWVIDNDTKKLKRREIKVLRPSRFGVLVREGLEPGEWIVVAGVHSVAEGEEVRIMDATREEVAS